MSGSGMVVNRWKRFGQDRLYVETTDGVKLGFWDLLTDRGYPQSPEHEAAITAAVTGWKAENASVVGEETPSSRTAATPVQASAAPGMEPADELPSLLAGKPVDATRTPGPTAPLGVTASATRDVAAPTETPRPWLDLATNQPGSEAREQAQSARDAAPVKSLFARALGVHTDERAWRIGADGEEKVAAQLTRLMRKDSRWRVLHAIPVGTRGSDIDHLVIGPGGVFTVNAKHHPGAKIWVGGNTLMVDGFKQPYVRNSRHEATRASKLLTGVCGFPVHVEGLVVTVNARDVLVKSQPEGVSVVPRMQVAKWLLRHGDIHTPETLHAIFQAARRSTTWR